MPRWLGVLGLCCAMMGGCADTATEQPSYVVKPQDTLYSIAWRSHVDVHDLARWNHIGADSRIVVGQTLRLTSPAGPTARSVPKPIAPAHPASPTPAFIPSAMKWMWPTDRLLAPRAVPGGGILIAGHLGQEVRAACAGRVVYSGNGIRGYGNLIIIKHGENLLTAYAHLRDMSAHEGEELALGQLIGHMGEGAPQTPILYFELRRDGKPIDPTPYLPK